MTHLSDIADMHQRERVALAIATLSPTERAALAMELLGITSKFSIGDKVDKVGGYAFPGEVRGILSTSAGEVRLVVELQAHPVGPLLHIFNEQQLVAKKPECVMAEYDSELGSTIANALNIDARQVKVAVLDRYSLPVWVDATPATKAKPIRPLEFYVTATVQRGMDNGERLVLEHLLERVRQVAYTMSSTIDSGVMFLVTTRGPIVLSEIGDRQLYYNAYSVVGVYSSNMPHPILAARQQASGYTGTRIER